ncbi:amino acid adenylation domain-containing protein [Streptomyces sp. O3]
MPSQDSTSWPLSAAQLGIWYAQRLDPASPVFVQGGYLDVQGPLDTDLFASALTRLVAEDQTTRLRFLEVDGTPRQFLAPATEYRPEILDLRTHRDPDAHARRIISRDMAQVPDLADGPLFRHLLLRLEDQRLRWYFRAHHLMQDGYSGHLLQRRAGELYAELAGGAPAGPPLGLFTDLLGQYREYHDDSPALAKDRTYWRHAMDGAVCPPSRAAKPELRIAREVADVDRETLDGLRRFAQAAGVPWQQALIGAAVLHHHRRTGETDVVLSLPVTGRLTPAARRVTGMTANVLPLRVPVDPEASCAELMRQVGSRTLRVQWHQRYDAAELMRDLGWPADGRRQFGPVVNILASDEPPSFAGLPSSEHLLSTGGTADELGITVTHGEDGGLRVDFTVDEAYTESVPLASHRRSFLLVLKTLAASGPDLAVRDVPVLASDERELVVSRWNDTTVPISDDTLNTLFEKQAAQHPDATAVIFDDHHLTYRQLNEQANRLAHHLTHCAHVRRGDLVGVLLHRGTDFATALIAITKTGAGYTILDPEFPDQRLTTTAANARITTLITDTTLTHRTPGNHTTLLTDTDTPHLHTHPHHNPTPHTTPHDSACVMFTSGSTGTPKGVLSTHQNLISTLTHQTYTTLSPHETLLQCSPVSWDAFSLEFWGPLLHGGTTVLQPGQRPDPTLINQLTHQHHITQLQLSSSLFNYLTDEHPDTFTTTHTAYTGGEPASPTHIHKLRQHHPHLTITNGYGPAESMGFTTTHTTTPTPTPPPTIPIGTPLTNKHAYILDTHLNPTPIGTTGEIYLSGHGLAHGYLNQPTTTATHFIPNPYGPPGTRLYRTGDTGHWTPNGTLHYTGRTDTQTKIRGFRIEPAEIETTLTQHPHITQAAVITHHNGPTAQLAAYIIPTPHTTPTPQDIRTWARTQLPDHMVPTHITPLTALPLTPNGKLDRTALPTPTTTTTQGRPPRTPLEHTLTTLFTHTLNTPHPLTIDDNFFDHGGHSLLAAKLTNHIRTHTNTHLTLRDIFHHPTPATLAHHIGDNGPETGPTGPATITAGPRPERVPLSHAQRRLWLLAGLEGESATYNVPLTARFRGELDLPALRRALADVMARHEPLRTVCVTVDDEPVQRILPPDEAVPHLEHRRTDRALADAELSAAARHPFDLERDMPLRVTVLDTGDGEFTVLILLHHIATDGQSLGPLLADLSTAYAARREGRAPDWSPLPVQYADYALWQRRALGSADDEDSPLGRDLAFWREQLKDLPEELGLVLDRPRPAVASHRGAALPIDFGTGLYTRIEELARAERCTPFMVVHAALAAALTRLGAGEDIPLGSPVAGRDDESLSGLVGFFVNTVVLRTDTSGDPSFRTLLNRVRAADLDAFAHQEAPFDQVLEAVAPRRSASRHPLFQVCLGLENGGTPRLRLAGAADDEVSVLATGSAKFDLEFLLRGDASAGLTGGLVYNRDLFDETTAQRLVDTFHRILDQVLTAPGLALSELAVLSADERELVVSRWNDTTVPISDDTLNTLFEKQAAQHPDATAVIFDDHHLTYRQLNEQANRLAHHLTHCAHVRRGDLVGVLLHRGTDFATALIAITKTGAGYTILDPEFPDQRLTTTAANARITTLITDTTLTHRTPGNHTTLLTDTDTPHLHTHPHHNPTPHTTPHDSACVMFTSGSTGTPKGVLSTHQNLISTLTHQTYTTLSPHETLLQCSPVSWDAFSLEFWGPLLHGGTTVLQPGQRPDPTLINQLTHQHHITQLQLSSSLFNYLTDEHPDTFTTTHTAYTGGEPASPTHIHKLRQHHPHLTITNGYGPAESMGFTTTHTTTPTPTPPPTIPIGTPLTNKHAYILDTHLNPTPIGTTGEIYLSGHGLAHGYLNQPTTTATHFIPNPYGPPGTRLYRTGDTGHWTPNGTLHYTGRTDTQTKIRGFRIEPAEIETTLTQHPHITQAAVITHHNGPTAQLAAYIIPTPHTTPTPQDIRTWARTQLPDHMVPTHITPLTALPLTPNRKLDRTAHPTPTTTPTQGRPPRTPLEHTLTTLFTHTLNTPHPLTIDDNFFDHGGHSLLAAKLTNHIRTHTNTHLTLRDIFHHPTPATLAHHISTTHDHDGPHSQRDASADASRTKTPSRRRARPTLRRRTAEGARAEG